MVTTPLGESVVAKMVYRHYPLMLPNRVTYVELVGLDMVNFMSFWVWINCMNVLHLKIVERELLSPIFQMNLS